MSQPSPLSPARQHARTLADAGDLNGARAVLERAVELGKVNLSEDDPDVLQTAYQLGGVLQQVDDPMAARRVLEEAYGAGLWRLGDSDPLMLQISHDIGAVAEELGNRHEARKAFGRVAELGPGTLGASHWAVARAQAYLGQDQPEVRRSRAKAIEEPTTALPPVPRPRQAPSEPPTVFHPAQESRSVAPAFRPRQESSGPAPRFGPGPSAPVSATPPSQPSPMPPPSQPAPESAREVWPGPSTSGGYFTPPPPVVPERVPEPQTYRKGLGVFAAVAAVLAAVVAVAALVFVLANRTSDSSDSPDVPTLGGPPPTDVALRDDGSDVSLSWTDPADGTVSFIVAMSRSGEQFQPIGTVGPGQTSYKTGGLNPAVNYCFTVIAVYRGDKFATSAQVCTSRPAATPK